MWCFFLIVRVTDNFSGIEIELIVADIAIVTQLLYVPVQKIINFRSCLMV